MTDEQMIEAIAEVIHDYLDERFPGGVMPGGQQVFADDHLDAEFKHEAGCDELARRVHSLVAAKVAELEDWAFEQSRCFHQLAHENEPLRIEHIASSAAYRELGLKLRERAALAPHPEGTDQ